MSICRGLVPALAVGVVMEVNAPFDPTEKSETFDDPLLATYRCAAVESKMAAIGWAGAVPVLELGAKGEPGIEVRPIVFVELEY